MFSKGNKYHAKKVEIDGNVFASTKEAKRYELLKGLEKQGIISNLKLQVKYNLIPSQYIMEGKKRKCVERPCDYIADFVYNDNMGNTIVEDVKGCKIGGAYAVFKIKKKLMLEKYGIRVYET